MIMLIMAAIISTNLESYVDPSWISSINTLYPIITDIAIWDYDNDGKTEIAFTTYSLNERMRSTGHVYVLEYNGFVLEREFVSTESNSYQACQWFDYDEDGDSDLLVASSVTVAMDGYVGVFMNENGSLEDQMIVISNETEWDPLDLAFGDFNHDNVLDILVVCADRHPQILQGYYDNSGAFQIHPDPSDLSFTQLSSGSIPSSFLRASIADVNDDNIVDVLVAQMNFVGELTSNTDTDLYSLSVPGGKQVGLWHSCTYGPPVSSAPTVLTMLVGSAWEDGIGRVYENFDSDTDGYLLENSIEYVSDISAIYIGDNGDQQYYLSLSECGFLDNNPADPRSRRCRVNSWDYAATGGFYSTEYFADDIEMPLKPEAFCTEWTSITTSDQFEITYTFLIDDTNQRLFQISDSGVDFGENLRVKLGITNSEIQRSFQVIEAKVQYIENGLIYLRTVPQLGDVLRITFLTTNNPSPVFGRRGLLEVYEVFQ